MSKLNSIRKRKVDHSIGSLLGFFLFVALFSSPAHAVLLGVSFGSNEPSEIYSVSEITGQGQQLGLSVNNRINAMAISPSGIVYVSQERELGGPSRLLTLDLDSYLLSPATPYFRPGNDIRGLAFSNDGVLYGLLDTSGSFGVQRTLFSIDVATGATLQIGSGQRSGLQSLAFSPIENILYGWNDSSGLFRVDQSNGQFTQVNTNYSRPTGFSGIQALEFASDGTLYGARRGLFVVNPQTSEVTAVGSGGYDDIRGLAFVAPVPVPVPSPNVSMLLLTSLAFLTFFRRLNRKHTVLKSPVA